MIVDIHISVQVYDENMYLGMESTGPRKLRGTIHASWQAYDVMQCVVLEPYQWSMTFPRKAQ